MRETGGQSAERAGGNKAAWSSPIEQDEEGGEDAQDAEPVVGGVELFAKNESEPEQGRKRGETPGENPGGDAVEEQSDGRAEKKKSEVGNPCAHAEKFEEREEIELGGGESHLEEVAVESFTVEHALGVFEKDGLVGAGPDGDVGKEKEAGVDEGSGGDG